jgi:regulatory protein
VDPAYDDAVRLLARRDLSRRALSERLAAKGHEPAAVDDALARLEGRGELDDAAYARRFILSRGAARGRERVLAELAARGVADEVATRAWAVVAAEGARDDADALARAVRRRLGAPPGKADRARLARVYNALLSEGFEPASVASALVPYGFRGYEE